MNPRHPTIDEIADYDAGLTAASGQQEIADHLAECPECRALAAHLTEVTDRLAAAGTEPLTMPADVAARLDEALASAGRERAAGPSSLADRRAEKQATSEAAGTSPGRNNRRARWMLGAAAAVAVFAIGGAVASNGLPGLTPAGEESGADSSAGSAIDNAGGGKAGSGSAAPSPAQGGEEVQPQFQGANPPKLDQTTVSGFAQALTQGTASRLPTAADSRRAAARCGYPRPVPLDSGAVRQLDAFVVFEGDPALLRVRESDRSLTVLSCPGPARVLYRSTY